MITMFGMSKKFGLMALATTENQYLGGQSAMNCAESTAAEADAEIRELLGKCYEESCQMRGTTGSTWTKSPCSC